SAGVVTGLGRVAGRTVMLIANDATVKAGAFFPMTVKKVLRAQRIALENRLPLVYLVDSAGVFLPLQDEVFPDEDDFGRIFRNNAVISAAGVPQYAAILGNCVAGGKPPGRAPAELANLFRPQGQGEYDVRDLLPCLLDEGPFDEYKAEYGQTLVCGYGRLGGVAVGVVANQRKRCRTASGTLEF